MGEKGQFSGEFEGIDNLDVSGRGFVRALFSNCTFRNMRGAHLVNCTMEDSRVEIDDVRNLLGLTLTLNCHTFRGLKLSETACDALLYLVSMSAPKDRAEAVRSLLEPTRLRLFDKVFPVIE